MGKIIGGLPIGAIGGRNNVMKVFDASDAVTAAREVFGNPLSMVAGLVAMKRLDRAAFARLESPGDIVRD